LAAAFARVIDPAFGSDTLSRRVLLIVHTLGVEQLPVVSSGVSKIVENGVPLDVIAASPDIDYRAWERIAHDGKGNLLVPRVNEMTDQVIARYRTRLAEQRVCDISLKLNLSEQLRYVRVFWAGDEPAFLLDREPAEMSTPLRLSMAPTKTDTDACASWVFVAIVPRRRSGRYRLIEVELTGTTSRGPISSRIEICHTVSTQPNDARLVDGAVGAQSARVRPSFWVEELGQALSHEDGARILNLYDPFIRWAREEGQKELVDTLWSAKRAFQRGGYFGTRQLNEFWRMSHQGLDD
jgi:hypothetical protein